MSSCEPTRLPSSWLSASSACPAEQPHPSGDLAHHRPVRAALPTTSHAALHSETQLCLEAESGDNRMMQGAIQCNNGNISSFSQPSQAAETSFVRALPTSKNSTIGKQVRLCTNTPTD